MNSIAPRSDWLLAIIAREFRSALLNRYFQVFATLALLGGMSAATFSEDGDSSAFFILQILLYIGSLFATLMGVSAARAECEEWPLLFSQPLPRFAIALGKMLALAGVLAVALVPLFAPPLFVGAPWMLLARLYLQGVQLTVCFGCVGLTAGFVARDRAQGLIFGAGAWLLLLFGVDLVALLAAHTAAWQRVPDFWVAGLMLNPLDSFRIGALFSMEAIPAEAAGRTPLAHWWIDHAIAWFLLLASVWTALLLALSGRTLNRWEE